MWTCQVSQKYLKKKIASPSHSVRMRLNFRRPFIMSSSFSLNINKKIIWSTCLSMLHMYLIKSILLATYKVQSALEYSEHNLPSQCVERFERSLKHSWVRLWWCQQTKKFLTQSWPLQRFVIIRSIQSWCGNIWH